MFSSSMYKWGLAPSSNCECSATKQTADPIISACPILQAPRGVAGLTVLNDDNRCPSTRKRRVNCFGNGNTLTALFCLKQPLLRQFAKCVKNFSPEKSARISKTLNFGSHSAKFAFCNGQHKEKMLQKLIIFNRSF